MAEIGKLQLRITYRWWYPIARHVAIWLILTRTCDADAAARWIAKHAIIIKAD